FNPRRDSSLGSQRLFDLRHQRPFEIVRSDPPDQLEGNPAIAANDKRLRHAVDAPFDRRAAAAVAPDGGKRVAETTEKAPRAFRLVLLIDGDDANAMIAGKSYQQRSLVTAWDAPRCPHVDQRDRACEIRRAEAGHGPAVLFQTQHRRQVDVRYGTPNQGRRN